MSGSADPASAVEALRAGAEGFLPKTSEPEELLPPLLAILDGWAVLPAELLRAMLRPDALPRPSTSTARNGGCCGRSPPAAAPSTSPKNCTSRERTVKRMTAALLRKLRVSNRAEAAAVAGHSGILGE